MVTPVVRSIGSSGRNYGTLSLWRASIATSTSGNLVIEDTYYRDECYNDTEFVNDMAALSGYTTDATHTITLTAAAGQSFADHANAQTNALRYNQANGVGFRNTTNYHVTAPVQIAVHNVTVSRLQMKKGGNYFTCLESYDSNNCVVKGNLFDGGDTYSAAVRHFGYAPGYVFTNNLIIVTAGGNGLHYQNSGDGSLSVSFNTIVAPSDAGGATAIYVNYETVELKNCAIFGFTNIAGGGATQTYVTCMTDKASPPSGCTQVTYANQFVNTTAAGADFRVKAGADLINAATTDATYGATDIVGTTRPQGASYDIGCWEFVSVAAPAYRPRVVRWA
jgi:hypothetical protein